MGLSPLSFFRPLLQPSAFSMTHAPGKVSLGGNAHIALSVILISTHERPFKTSKIRGGVMAKVAREMVEKAGVNVEQILELLVKNASAELTTFYYYTILRVNLIGLDGEGIKEIAEVARIEDRNHFEALVPRIYELGGRLPDHMNDFHNIAACPPAKLPQDPKDINGMLNVLVNAERCAVRGYTNICNLTAGKDHRTYDLSLAILNEEIEHESWFSEFLGEGPSGHFMRRGDTSPFVSKFLK